MKKVALHNLGCKVNSYEIDSIKEQLIRAGYEVVPFKEGADIYIINTCTVTNIADRKSRQMLHKAKKLNPLAMVIATGCYAQSAKEELEKDECIDFILGNNYKGKVVEAIKNWENNIEQEYFSEITFDEEFEDIPISNISGHVRAYIKIQDGCNRFCSYCIIPYVRGRVRSRSFDSIIHEAKKLSENGVAEIVLTGIQLSAYGLDFDKKSEHLVKVVEELANIDKLSRIRLGSLEPNVITEEFVHRLSRIKKFCPQFHLSLQSGSDSVLRRMKRPYTTSRYLKACNMIRDNFDMPAITTDIIVGFPGETDKEFNETKSFVKEIKLAQTHIFQYSKRKGTKAALMIDQVNDMIKKNRAIELEKITNKLQLEYLHNNINKQKDVIIEDGYITIDGKEYSTGHTKEYIKVAIPGHIKKNTLINIEIISVDEERKLLIARRKNEV